MRMFNKNVAILTSLHPAYKHTHTHTQVKITFFRKGFCLCRPTLLTPMCVCVHLRRLVCTHDQQRFRFYRIHRHAIESASDKSVIIITS